MHSNYVIVLGGGDLASGVAIRLFRAGIKVVITELPKPLVVRRTVAFGEAIYKGQVTVENVTSVHAHQLSDVLEILKTKSIPVLVDPELNLSKELFPLVVVDGRMRKKSPEFDRTIAPLVIGIGPGYVPGTNCHAAVETKRGHNLGRALWDTSPEENTGIPGSVTNQGLVYSSERVLKAPNDGIFRSSKDIGIYVRRGERIGDVDGVSIFAPFSGILRGLIHTGLFVSKDMKVGDVDPRNDPKYCKYVSDKALAVGGGVLEVILSRPDIRSHLWK